MEGVWGSWIQVEIYRFLEESSCLHVAHGDTTCKVCKVLLRLARNPTCISLRGEYKRTNGVEVLEMYLQDD